MKGIELTNRKIDLHLHSLASDGRLSPTELVELAQRNGVQRLALTDHDTTAGVPEAVAAGRRLGVEVVAGVELSADVGGADELHMLGLFLDYEDQRFQSTLARLREGRIGRAEAMVGRLAELGVPVSWERVQEIAGEASVGRPHLAEAMLRAGHVASIREAFDRFLANGGPAYVARERLTPERAIELIHAVGGLAVMAHPLEGDGVTHLIPSLARAGLDGVECYYYSYNRQQVAGLVGLARTYGLVPTGGSDFHGFPMSGLTDPTNEPGTVDIPIVIWNDLVTRRRALLSASS